MIIYYLINKMENTSPESEILEEVINTTPIQEEIPPVSNGAGEI
jgi:hypothetical protein